MPKLHLVMPMAGRGSRFFDNGFVQPKPLIEIHGKPFFYWATRSIEKNIPLDGITFVVLREHLRDFDLESRIRAFWPDARIVALEDVTPGAAVTCQKGCEGLPDGVPVLFNDCDHLFLCSAFDEFCRAGNFAQGPDGALLTFPSDSPAYSYLQYGVEEAIARNIGALENGADIAFTEGARTIKDIERIGREVQGWNMFDMLHGGASPDVSYEDLIQMGYRLVTSPKTLHYIYTSFSEIALRARKECSDAFVGETGLKLGREYDDYLCQKEWKALGKQYNPDVFQGVE